MLILPAFAHEGQEIAQKLAPDLAEIVRANSLQFTLTSLGILLAIVVISAVFKNKGEVVKLLLFILIGLVSFANTIYLAGSTIYLNQISESKGPIHYHADFEIWNCGTEVEVENPKGFANKIGTEVVHEHNDKRMHFEGVILDLHDVSPSHFFESLGGSMSNSQLTVPTQGTLLTLKNNQRCLDGKVGLLQVFVYQTKNSKFFQKKLTDPQNYQISLQGNIPPGDCIIFEFASAIKNTTDKLCQSYQVAKELGKIDD